MRGGSAKSLAHELDRRFASVSQQHHRSHDEAWMSVVQTVTSLGGKVPRLEVSQSELGLTVRAMKEELRLQSRRLDSADERLQRWRSLLQDEIQARHANLREELTKRLPLCSTEELDNMRPRASVDKASGQWRCEEDTFIKCGTSGDDFGTCLAKLREEHEELVREPLAELRRRVDANEKTLKSEHCRVQDRIHEWLLQSVDEEFGKCIVDLNGRVTKLERVSAESLGSDVEERGNLVPRLRLPQRGATGSSRPGSPCHFCIASPSTTSTGYPSARVGSSRAGPLATHKAPWAKCWPEEIMMSPANSLHGGQDGNSDQFCDGMQFKEHLASCRGDSIPGIADVQPASTRDDVNLPGNLGSVQEGAAETQSSHDMVDLRRELANLWDNVFALRRVLFPDVMSDVTLPSTRDGVNPKVAALHIASSSCGLDTVERPVSIAGHDAGFRIADKVRRSRDARNRVESRRPPRIEGGLSRVGDVALRLLGICAW